MLKISGDLFLDEFNRMVLLRGVNLGGSTKVPTKPNGATHIPTDFSDFKNVSFIDHPFPLAEADEHFKRLQNWGYNCLRVLTTWEAIEHEAPGKYDKKYLEYLRKILEKAGEYGFYCFIDPHQDVWSRMTGGDGAPAWTFEKVGLDFTKFDETGAALIMQAKYPKEYPMMVWSTNYFRFACATMFTLFFSGNDFAPGFTVNGETIQNYLQNHFINAMKEVAKIAKDLPNVIGYDIFNEPNKGFIGAPNLTDRPRQAVGLHFNAFEAMATASGCSMPVSIISFKGIKAKEIGKKLVNPNKISCWLPKARDIWREMGIWGVNREGQPQLLKSDYFSKHKDGSKVNFFWDYLKPFINKYAESMQVIHKEAMIFIESDAVELISTSSSSITDKKMTWLPTDAKNIVNALHWYDGLTLYLRQFIKWFNADTRNGKPVFLYKNIKKLFVQQLKMIKGFSEKLGNSPTLIGEFGIPFNLYKGRAYRTNNWSKHNAALTLHHTCMDDNLLNFTMWNYTADNCNKWGDLWNLEDLSIFSRDQQKNPLDINSGGRAIEGFCRPYVRNISGKLINMAFNRKASRFIFEYNNNPSIKEPTEVFIPKIQYPAGYRVKLSEGHFEKDPEKQLLKIYGGKEGLHRVEIKRYS